MKIVIYLFLFNLIYNIPTISDSNAYTLERKLDKILKENEELKKHYDELKKEINDLKKSNILLISEVSNSLLNYLLQIYPYYNKISVLPPNFIIPRLKEDFMNKYKIIIYDLKDCGFGIAEDLNEIKKYLNNGGNIIITHDHWFHPYYYNGKCYELFNTVLDINQDFKRVNLKKIVNKTHPILSSFYQLNENNLKISITHRCQNKYLDKEYLKDMIIELEDGLHGEYLLIKNYGKGRLIYWNVGEVPSLTSDEEKLLVNIISWIFQNE